MTQQLVTRSFAVSDVEPGTRPLPSVAAHQSIKQFLGAVRLESCSHDHRRFIANVRSHPLIGALHSAFNEHYPVCLTPDAVWLTLLQGLASHINAHAEELRRHFVQHDGKLKIEVRRDDFVKESPENAWPDVFSEFSAQLKTHLGATHSLIVADFSTTGPVERAASEVALMDTMQAYFEYESRRACSRMPSSVRRLTVIHPF